MEPAVPKLANVELLNAAYSAIAGLGEDPGVRDAIITKSINTIVSKIKDFFAAHALEKFRNGRC